RVMADIVAVDMGCDGGGNAADDEAFAGQRGRAGLRAVAADHHQAVDAAGGEVAQRRAAPGGLGELGAARAAEHGAAVLHDAADVARAQRLHGVGEEPGVAVAHAEHLRTPGECGARHGAHRGVHAGRGATAGPPLNSSQTSLARASIASVRNPICRLLTIMLRFIGPAMVTRCSRCTNSARPGRRASSAYRPSVGTNRIAKSVVAGGSRYFSRMVFASSLTRISSALAASSTAAGSARSCAAVNLS